MLTTGDTVPLRCCPYVPTYVQGEDPLHGDVRHAEEHGSTPGLRQQVPRQVQQFFRFTSETQIMEIKLLST